MAEEHAGPGAAPEIDARYQIKGELGRGSMGVVHLCHDPRIGRDVAMKVILRANHESARARARFLREARVQGQLEHPSIAPLYDLEDDGDALYFTMKRLRGLTLKEILTGLRAGDREMAQAFTRRRLLTSFRQVCLAVDFAHAHGVIHRDIKPSNVMIGAYGEVYVLDWGVAKLSAEGDVGATARPSGDNEKTAPGKIVGTFGYLSPEQALGRVATVDARSDVYSLGAVLFELLTLEPLHRDDTWSAVVFATVHGISARPSERRPEADVPPELEEICVKATAIKPEDRYPSARALCDAIDRFLDGDRDLALRRAMAEKHARVAEDAAARAVRAEPTALAARKEAIAAVGRTLALDPDNDVARRVLTDLISKPPREIPPDVVTRVDAHATKRYRFQVRQGILFDVMSPALMMPILFWMGLKSVPTLAGIIAFTLASALLKLAAMRQPSLSRAHDLAHGAYVCNVLALLCIGRGFGPLFFSPALIALATFGYSMSTRRAYRLRVLLTGGAAFLASVAIEVLGLLPRSYAFHDGAMTILPQAVTLPMIPTLVALTSAGLFLIIAPALMMGRIMAQLGEAEERSFLQTWHLRQLLPEEAQDPVLNG